MIKDPNIPKPPEAPDIVQAREYMRADSKAMQAFLKDLANQLNWPVISSDPTETPQRIPMVKLDTRGYLWIYFDGSWKRFFTVDLLGGFAKQGSVVDGDQLDIDWNPANYTPDATPAEAADVDDLTAHLKGIDDEISDIYDYIDAAIAGVSVPRWNYEDSIAVGTASTKNLSVVIPSDVCEIEVSFWGVSGSAACYIYIQIGDSGGFETSGYLSSTTRDTGSGSGAQAITTGFIMCNSDIFAAGDALSGTVRIMRYDKDYQQYWLLDGCTVEENGYSFPLAGRKSLSGTLDRIRVGVSAGVFDAGYCTLRYRRE